MPLGDTTVRTDEELMPELGKLYAHLPPDEKALFKKLCNDEADRWPVIRLLCKLDHMDFHRIITTYHGFVLASFTETKKQEEANRDK